jgi:hypothetical protein
MTRSFSAPENSFTGSPMLSINTAPNSHEITIVAYASDGAHALGTFTDPAKAWAEIDKFDIAC